MEYLGLTKEQKLAAAKSQKFIHRQYLHLHLSCTAEYQRHRSQRARPATINQQRHLYVIKRTKATYFKTVDTSYSFAVTKSPLQSSLLTPDATTISHAQGTKLKASLASELKQKLVLPVFSVFKIKRVVATQVDQGRLSLELLLDEQQPDVVCKVWVHDKEVARVKELLALLAELREEGAKQKEKLRGQRDEEIKGKIERIRLATAAKKAQVKSAVGSSGGGAGAGGNGSSQLSRFK